MPHNAISISQAMEQNLYKRRGELNAKLVELQQDLEDLAHDEKDSVMNSGLHAAQKEIAYIEGKISELDEVLSNAVVVIDDPNCLTVAIGKRVVLEMHRQVCNCDEIEPEQLEVIVDGVKGYAGTDDEVVTPESPVGKAIFGAAKEEERTFVSPRGKEFKIVIVSITSSC